MIHNAWLLIWMFSLVAQTPGQASLPGTECLSPADRTRLNAEVKLDQRVKIYREASERCKSMLIGLIQKQETQAVPAQLKAWAAILGAALQDIERSPGRKDKSRAIKDFEIRLRRSLSSVQELKIKTGIEQEEDFDSWLSQAEEIRKKLVGILFPK